ncbi:Hypothetical protein SRAE_X000111900 [Strongyloides ratti]|uniref:Uncharacterized protein n=1 Tax=Strongyloides ratti TaxID=34506 RepID=A0A090KU31_STRRB|nr:Hypothetical protein SRAE_X000111900 [Strongyloides ratti]CEF59370.1 Hypothetical protein SRAE_X000111900 [Strongyloides ratti]
MASLTIIISILFIKLKFKYYKLKSKEIIENGISVTKISKFTPTISLDIFETPRDNNYYGNMLIGDNVSLKSVNSAPTYNNTLEPGPFNDQKRRVSEETRFTKNSARSFSEVFENLNALKLEKMTNDRNKVVNENGIVMEPVVTSIQELSLSKKNIPIELECLKNDMIVNKALQKVKKNPKDRILKKIDSSIIMFYGEPIYNITKDTVKPGEFKL